MMKAAAQKDDVFLNDVERAATNEPEALHIWWLGQSGFLVTANRQRLVFDPYLSDSLTRKYAGTDKEHVRMTERVVAPEALTGIGIATSTHNHTDHLDAETLWPLKQANPGMKLIIPEANREFVRKRLNLTESGGDAWLIGLDAGETERIDNIQITGMPAAHNEIERDSEGRCKFMGYVVRMGAFTLYHSGDTRPIPGLAEKLKPFELDVAILPINGSLEERRVAGNLWGQEAAALADNAGAKCVIPCHFDMFEFNTVTPMAFQEACELRGLNYKVLRPGERYTLKA